MSAGLTYPNAGYRSNLVGNKSGAPPDHALRKLPGNNLSNAPALVATGSAAPTPETASGALTRPVSVHGRLPTHFNTAPALFPPQPHDASHRKPPRRGTSSPVPP